MYEDYVVARKTFWALFGGGLAAVFVAVVLPKPQGYAAPLRLILTIFFFAGLGCALFALTEPLRTLLKRWSAWRYEGCPASVAEWLAQYRDAIDRVAYQAAGSLFVAAAATGLLVLSHWPSFRFLQFVTIGLWLVLAAGGLAFAATLAMRGQYLAHVGEFRRQLDLEVARQAYVLRGPDADAVPKEAVRVLGENRFEAAGIAWDWEDFYRNGVVLGMTGAGKTSCVLNTLLDGLLRSGGAGALPPSAMIFDPKGEFEAISRLCKSLGRENDLLILDPEDPLRSIRWNPFDSADSELELAGRLVAAAEALGLKSGSDTFWIDSCRTFIRHSIALFRDVDRQTPPDLAQIIDLANDRQSVYALGGQASQAVTEACVYFANVWLTMPQETEGAIRAYMSNMLDAFTVEPYRTLFAGRSTHTIGSLIDEGKILYVRLPITKNPQMARTVLTLLKLEYQQEILRRQGKARSSVFFCDEFQTVFVPGEDRGDAHFFSLSRGANHVNLVSSQSLQGLKRRAKEEQAAIWDLLNNCGVKVFLHGEDPDTNDYASKLCGENTSALPSTGASTTGGMPHLGGLSFNQGAQVQFAPRIRPSEFTELKVPRRSSAAPYAETIVLVSTRHPVRPQRRRWRVHPLAKLPV